MTITTAFNKCGCSLTMLGDRPYQVSFCLEHLHLFDPDLTTRELHTLWIRIGEGVFATHVLLANADELLPAEEEEE